MRPEAQRQGVGTGLVRAAMREARRDGHRPAVPVHLPRRGVQRAVLRALGFEEATDLLPFQQRLREHETEIGLDVDGPRIVMSVALRP